MCSSDLNYLDDLELLDVLHRSAVRYIGVLGPRKRTERLLGELYTQDVSAIRMNDPRLHAPIGLDIGADTPEEIALSILAEVRAVFAERDGAFLRQRRSAIHDGPSHENPAVGDLLDLRLRDLMASAPNQVCTTI